MIEDLRARDIRHLWHPYTEISSFEKTAFPVIERAEGVYLYEVGGRKLLDGIASWWCVNLGHGHPRLVEAICRQARQLQHSILGGMSHPRVIELAERLVGIAPQGLRHVFFGGDGASAVEAALKIAVQYWRNVSERGRDRFICLEEGYHGDTLGAMGVGYVERFHADFQGVIHEAYRACSPYCIRCPFSKEPETCAVECFTSMQELVCRHHGQTAAVILEPLCQGAAGMRIYPEEYLRRLRRLCDEFGLLVIADEIAVGFGRTGKMWACERAAISPDIMTIGKGMTGGYLPMSATMVTDEIYDSFRRKDKESRTFLHGHTYSGNPITSALALAVLDAYEEEKVLQRCVARIEQLDRGMHKLGATLGGAKVRTMGMVGMMEVHEKSGGAERSRAIGEKALEMGLFLRPLGTTVYLWPALTVREEELAEMLKILERAVAETA